MPAQQTLAELKKEILLLIDYAAPENRLEEARQFVDKMQTDRIGLNILKEFYSFLPEAENDFVVKIQLLDSRHKTFLVLVTATLDRYLYLANIDRAEFLGKHADGIWDEEVLEFFGLDREEAAKKFHEPKIFPEYVPLGQSHSHCLVCSAKPGETHQLGCPVEICPWCGGQLTNCNCRFAKMGTEQLKTAEQIEDFLDLLNKKGRIPFEASQKLGGLRE
jgi:hypothetical protein